MLLPTSRAGTDVRARLRTASISHARSRCRVKIMMTPNLLLRRVAVTLSLGILSTQSTFAAWPRPSGGEDGPPTYLVCDVMLHKGGVILGQIVDSQGHGRSAYDVQLLQQGLPMRRTRTDESGQFLLDNLPAGVYQLSTASGNALVRAWAPQTAPPVAQPSVLIVDHTTTVRTQGGPPFQMGNAVIGAAIIGAAVAIPLAVANNDDDSAS